MSPTIGTSTFTFLEIDDGSISIWMMVLALRCEVGDAPGYAVVKTRADRNQTIGVAYRRVGGVRAVHPEHPQA